MRRIFTTRAAIIIAVATIMVAISAGVSLGAPVLPYGMTSAPGMSGTCTNCHAYAPAPTTPPVVTPPTPTTPPVVTAGDNEKPEVEKAVTHKKAHHKKHHAKRHVRHHRERD
jgi:hypothetical protein